MSYTEFLAEHGSRLVSGAIITAQQTVLAAILAVAIAVVVGLMRLSGNGAVRGTAICYIEFFRGTSLLVQLYWIFFAEVVRGAIQSVPRGQYEAALALNMSPLTRMRRIIFPQAILIMLPPWGNLLIELLKGTALVALISVSDLMFEAKQINGSTFLSIEAFGTALIIYYVMARLFVTPSMRWFERFTARKMGRA
jgi:polar amino acid transport system permease protein